MPLATGGLETEEVAVQRFCRDNDGETIEGR
jgi:hypothetical protein